jgi:hypothetical protein
MAFERGHQLRRTYFAGGFGDGGNPAISARFSASFRYDSACCSNAAFTPIFFSSAAMRSKLSACSRYSATIFISVGISNGTQRFRSLAGKNGPPQNFYRTNGGRFETYPQIHRTKLAFRSKQTQGTIIQFDDLGVCTGSIPPSEPARSTEQDRPRLCPCWGLFFGPLETRIDVLSFADVLDWSPA